MCEIVSVHMADGTEYTWVGNVGELAQILSLQAAEILPGVDEPELSCMCGVDIKHVAALAGMVAVHNTVERPIFGDWLIEEAKQGVAA